MHVLITGFEPFAGYAENSSWVVTEKVTALDVCGVTVSAEKLPVSFGRVASVLSKAVEEHSPDVVIILGQSPLSNCIKLERFDLI